MTFDEADDETRSRLAESTTFLAHLRSIAPRDLSPIDDLQKALRAHWLVSLYAAVERGVNAIVEASLSEIALAAPEHERCVPPLHSIIQYSKIQAVRDCANRRLFDSSVDLFVSAFSADSVVFDENPLSERLQNVDGGTIHWVMSLFGVPLPPIPASNLGRLSNLRERRNAVAHGRESAVKVGERFSLDELATLYRVADEELARMSLAMRDFCTGSLYLRQVA